MRLIAIALFALMALLTECGGDDHTHEHGEHDHEHGEHDHAHE